MSGQLFDTRYLQEQYELLRGQALSVSTESCGPAGGGLVLFLSRGMVAWMQATSCLSSYRVASEEPPGSSASTPTAGSEVTTVLANMVLACMKEAPG